MAAKESATARRRGKSTAKTEKAVPEPPVSDEELRQIYASNRRSRMIILGICVLFRLANASITRTYDNPDEYWQAQEVAHRLVFGYPFLKLVLAKKTLGDTIAPSVLFCTLASFFNFHMAGRTLSNSLEMILTVIALNYWPLDGTVIYDNAGWIRDFRISLAWAALACVIRPTNALLWGFLGLRLLYKTAAYRNAIIANTAIVLITAVALSTLVDTWCYDGHLGNLFSEPVFTAGKFFELNVISAISVFYGMHSWHWYLSQGIPVVLASFLPTFLFGWYRTGQAPLINERLKALKYLCVWTVAVYSLLTHKEFRFIYPVVPIMHIIAAYGISQLPARWRKWAVLSTMAINISLGIYTTTVHQRGVVDAVNYIRSEAQDLRRMYTEYDMEVAFLMPCHSTPWQSIIHDKNVNTWMLTCEPPLRMSATDYMDEADIFYESPTKFITEKILPSSSRTAPAYVVVFDSLLQMPSQANHGSKTIGDLLRDQGEYTECARFFNSHFHDDWRRRGDVVVLCQQK
ncbi:glycosylphosphatidylinositol anchor biosynthesis [Umbelopsis nana]